MKKFTYTKGPWWMSTAGEILKMPEQIKITNFVSGANRQEAENNTRLVTASPELYEELLDAYKRNEFLGKNNTYRWSDEKVEQVKKLLEKITCLTVEELMEEQYGI